MTMNRWAAAATIFSRCVLRRLLSRASRNGGPDPRRRPRGRARGGRRRARHEDRLGEQHVPWRLTSRRSGGGAFATPGWAAGTRPSSPSPVPASSRSRRAKPPSPPRSASRARRLPLTRGDSSHFHRGWATKTNRMILGRSCACRTGRAPRAVRGRDVDRLAVLLSGDIAYSMEDSGNASGRLGC